MDGEEVGGGGEVGGLGAMFDSFPAERLRAIDWSFGFSGESEVPFWGFVVGGVQRTERICCFSLFAIRYSRRPAPRYGVRSTQSLLQTAEHFSDSVLFCL